MPWTIDDILKATGGERVAGQRDRRFDALGIDSRQIRPTEVFVAIRGAVHDGHRFIPEVLGRGVRGLVVGRDRLDALPSDLRASETIACVAVADTLTAIGLERLVHQPLHVSRPVPLRGKPQVVLLDHE